MSALEADPRVERLAGLKRELRRRQHLADPVKWVNERLKEHTWWKQKEVLRSVRDHRKTAVHSCHGAGKSFIAARAAAWWIENHPPGEAIVVTSAAGFGQVKTVLWKEMNRLHAKAELRGRMNQTEWWMTMPDGHEEMVAFGKKPTDENATAFQGQHARWVLVIFDEATGIEKPLWTAADSLTSNDECRFLAIGNPDDPETEFAEVCKPGSGWNVIGISAFETPNFTGEDVPSKLRFVLTGKTWVEEKRAKWGESNPMYISKVLGQFPEVSSDRLIQPSWVRAAQMRTLMPVGENELGIDVGAGGDRNVAAHRRGPVLRIIRRDHVPDTMVSCGNMVGDLQKTGATLAKIDDIGVGRGLVDRAKEQKLPVIGVNVAKEPKDKEHFANIRAEGYWGLRERFQDGDVDLDPKDEDLAAQLVDIKFQRSSRGKIIIESKDEIRRRGKSSPDDADATMLAFLPPHLCGPQPIKKMQFTLG